MEAKFFDSISREQQDAAAEMTQRLKREALERSERGGKTREDIKGSYARKLAARLAKV